MERVPEKPGDGRESSAQGVDLGTYQLAVKFENYAGRHTLLINGFPVERFPVMGRTRNQLLAKDLNTALIGEQNRAEIAIEPYLQTERDEVKTGPMRLTAWIQRDRGEVELPNTRITQTEVDSALSAWRGRADSVWTAAQAAVDAAGGGTAIDTLRSWARAHPMTVTTTFDNAAGPDFSALFEGAPVIEGTAADSARLRGYAMRLRELIVNREGAALYRELRPAAVAQAQADGTAPPVDSLRIQQWEIAADKGTKWFAERPGKTSFTRADVQLRRWAQGRLWEISREGGRALFDGWNIYVGETDGELRVLRLQ